MDIFENKLNLAAGVLIVDDDPGARLLLGTALEMAGFRVSFAADGASALQQFRLHPVDCVILDVVMPGMSGFDVCSALRGLPECRHVPILMQTSLDDMESVNRAYNAGATDFSSKGINPMLLAQRVKFLVRAKQTQDQLRESEARVRYLAYYDPLTSLPNRQRLLQILEQHVEWAVPRERGIAVLMLDIDNFSRINDTQGPAVGDVLLQEVANRLQYCLRDSERALAVPDSAAQTRDIKDCVARTGGDEFALALPGVSTADSAQVVAQRVQLALARPFVLAAAGDAAVGDHRHQYLSRSTRPAPRRSSRMPTQPCITARRPGTGASNSSRSRSARARPNGCHWRRTCARRWSGANLRCTINRASPSRICASRPSRRCCAGRIRNAVSSRPTNSSRWRSKAV